MKGKLFIFAMICVLAVGLSACGQQAADQPSESTGKKEETTAATTAEPKNTEKPEVTTTAAPAETESTEKTEEASTTAAEDKTEPIVAREGFSIHEISDDLFFRMTGGNTFKDNCIVPREDLRYLLVLHKDKEGNTHQGEMVVHKLIAEDVLEIFEKLYDAEYPIERMVLPDNYMANDEIMMRDNNSSSFNFRFISHTDRISKHGLGMAVDINTLYNPYHKIVTNNDGTKEEVIEPATGAPYLDRTKNFDYKIEKGDLCYELFIEKGFEWGGDWTDRKDYQHFELPTDITDKYSEMYNK